MGGKSSRAPGPINHGTPGGYQVHYQRGEAACAECRAGWNDDRLARRVRGGQKVLRVPVEVVGSLLLAAANDATRLYAMRELGPRTAAACIDRAAELDILAPAVAGGPAVVRRE